MSDTPQHAAYESGVVAAGAVITSPVMDLSNSDEVKILADNSAGGSDRTLKIQYLGPDGTTVLFETDITVTAATRKAAIVSAKGGMVPALPTGVTVLPLSPGRMQFQLAAAGAANGSLGVYGR